MGVAGVTRRKRFADRTSMGKSKVIPYRRWERFNDRHERRLKTNLLQQDEIASWCIHRGIALRVTNDGHHWQFRWHGHIGEWWPASAKFVIDKRWRNGIHVHDWQQLKAAIAAGLLTLEPKETGATK